MKLISSTCLLLLALLICSSGLCEEAHYLYLIGLTDNGVTVDGVRKVGQALPKQRGELPQRAFRIQLLDPSGKTIFTTSKRDPRRLTVPLPLNGQPDHSAVQREKGSMLLHLPLHADGAKLVFEKRDIQPGSTPLKAEYVPFASVILSVPKEDVQ